VCWSKVAKWIANVDARGVIAFWVWSGTGSKPAMSAMTRQAALAAFGSLARSLGPIRPGPLGRAAPAVITALKDGHRAVRSSALVTAGALLHGIGNHAVQLLPQMAPAILFAASTAIAAIATDAASAHAGVVSGEGGAIKSKTRRGSKGQMCDSGGDNAAALEAAAALAAIVALVRSLPKFISPYLPAILQLCLNPVVRVLCSHILTNAPHSRPCMYSGKVYMVNWNTEESQEMRHDSCRSTAQFFSIDVPDYAANVSPWFCTT
jgi:hypothetical protein